VLGIPLQLVSISEDDSSLGRVEHDPLWLGDLWPYDVEDVAIMRRHMVVGSAGGVAMRSFHGNSDDDGTGIVECADVPSGRLMVHGGDAMGVARIADHATREDPIATMVLTLEVDVLTDLLVSEPAVRDAIAEVASALDERATLAGESVRTLLAPLLTRPPALARHLAEPPECRDGRQEVDEPGFLDIPATAAAELLRRGLDRLPRGFDIAVLDLEPDASAQDIARAVAARAAEDVMVRWSM
jgi:hypothetical protein